MKTQSLVLMLAAIIGIGCAAAAQSSLSRSIPSQGLDDAAAALAEGKLPLGYRDWRVISAAEVGPPLSDIRLKLGNDLAIKASRDGAAAFPDGAVIARLAYKQTVSEENNKVLRAGAEKQGMSAEQIEKLLAGSFVAGPATNVQFMFKESKRYASTGGWGFAQFTDGKSDGAAAVSGCFSCHAPGKDHDFVFTHYSP